MTTKSILTSYGNAEILEAIAEETTVSVSAIVYGDGNGEDYEPSVDQTSLVNQLGKLTSIVKEFNPADGFVYFKAIIPANADSFTLREFGLVDNNDNLLSVTVIPGIEKPVSSDGVSIALPISIGFKTSTGELMVIVEDGTDVYATTSLNNLNNAGEHHFDNTYATINLNNLSLEGERHFLGRTHITNCTTEIPQKLKFTLESGTLTLKAGSTIVVPYGTTDLTSTYPVTSTFLNENFKVAATQYTANKFFVWATVQADMSMTYTTGAYNFSVFVNLEDNVLAFFNRLTDASGTTSPSDTSTFYNTSTNIINRYSAGTITTTNLSFPVARITTTESEIATIDEIANGINHMGNVLIIDKDVRLLVPNGRNENGSLNNIATITSSLIFGYIPTIHSGTYEYFYDYTDNAIACWPEESIFLSSPDDTLTSNRIYYDFTTNKYTQYYNSVKTEKQYCHIGSFFSDKASTKITQFNAKLAFRAMDYNDFVLAESQINTTVKQIGEPVITLSNTLQDNEVWLEGAVVSRTAYAKLFAIYGTTYGAGDGSTTFKLPDFRNRAIWGANSFGYLPAGLPNITGFIDEMCTYSSSAPSGAFYQTKSDTWKKSGRDQTLYEKDVYFDASRSSAIYGASSTVQPPAIKVRVKTRYI